MTDHIKIKVETKYTENDNNWNLELNFEEPTSESNAVQVGIEAGVKIYAFLSTLITKKKQNRK